MHKKKLNLSVRLTVHMDLSCCSLITTHAGVFSTVIQLQVHDLHLHLEVFLPHLVLVSVRQELTSSPPLHRRNRLVKLAVQNHTAALSRLLVHQWTLKSRR